MKKLDSGTVRYSARGFHQDAMAAMRGDIVRALIELITNADDAYAALDDGRTVKRAIHVEVEHRKNRPWTVRVRDRATGMTLDDMRSRITDIAQRTSGFESGHARRGNLGRGAKDCAAFGDVTFSSIVEGRLAELVLQQTGDWRVLADRNVRKSERDKLSVPHNGTTVTIDVAANIRCPRHDTLRSRLSLHYQLRDILADPFRRVKLVNLNDDAHDLLTYVPPEGETVFDEEIVAEGYSYPARLTIRRMRRRYDKTYQVTGRPNGILLKGRRAIYENSLFGHEGEIHAGWFRGELRCAGIDELAREFDDRFDQGVDPSPLNSTRIILRNRDGLNSDHPFVSALAKAVDRPLGALIAEEVAKAKEGGRAIESEQTRSALDKLGREVARLVSSELRDMEAEELPGDLNEQPPALAIVPEVAVAYLGEDRTLTVAARKDDVAEGDAVEIDADPAGVVEILTPVVPLQRHRWRDDLLVGQIRIRPLIESETTLITARLDVARVADALVEVRAERETETPEPDLPETLEFTRPYYRVGLQRNKTLALIAPESVVEAHGYTASIVCDNPGIVLRGHQVRLAYDAGRGCYYAPVRVEARQLGAAGEIEATVGELVATTRVKVTRKEKGPRFTIQFEPGEMGIFRAVMEKDETRDGTARTVIKIAAGHPALKIYLGEDYSGQDMPLCREIIAEIVADLSARMVVEELFRSRLGFEKFDAYRIYCEHYTRVRRFLPRFQRILVGRASEVAADIVPTATGLLETVVAE